MIQRESAGRKQAIVKKSRARTVAADHKYRRILSCRHCNSLSRRAKKCRFFNDLRGIGKLRRGSRLSSSTIIFPVHLPVNSTIVIAPRVPHSKDENLFTSRSEKMPSYGTEVLDSYSLNNAGEMAALLLMLDACLLA